jgi:hypothetical protein
MNTRLGAISQRLHLALAMIPIQKANVAETKLVRRAADTAHARLVAASVATDGLWIVHTCGAIPLALTLWGPLPLLCPPAYTTLASLTLHTTVGREQVHIL